MKINSFQFIVFLLKHLYSPLHSCFYYFPSIYTPVQLNSSESHVPMRGTSTLTIEVLQQMSDAMAELQELSSVHYK